MSDRSSHGRVRPTCPFLGKFPWAQSERVGRLGPVVSRTLPGGYLDGRDLGGGPRLCASAQWRWCTSQWRLVRLGTSRYSEETTINSIYTLSFISDSVCHLLALTVSLGSIVENSGRRIVVPADPGIGFFFYTRKGQCLYKISLYIIIYQRRIMMYHVVSCTKS